MAKQAKPEKPPKGGADKPEKAPKVAADKAEKASKGGGEKAKGGADKAAADAGPPPVPRLRDQYRNDIVPALQTELALTNRMAVPRIEKVVVSMGVGQAKDNIKLLDTAVAEMTLLTGQKAVQTRAKKAISNFKLRENMPIGARVTLRGDRMWFFLDRLINIALPRVRDFRGISRRAFDGQGNYTLGLKDQLIFPEIDYGKVDLVKGMNITIVTTAGRDDHALALLEKLGVPFVRKES